MNPPVWVVIPTRNEERARTACLRWTERGYKTFAILDDGTPWECGAHRHQYVTWTGYWDVCNAAALDLVESGAARTVVLAADDMDPDPNYAPDVIESECYARYPDGYFVMQPCGDDQHGMDGVWRICGSPWFGDGWIRSAYGGRGPCPLPYRHFYGDEELFNVAKTQCVLWQREGLSHFHHHWCRNDEHKTKRLDYQRENSDKWWEHDKALFMSRMAAGFPGSERACTTSRPS